MARFYCSEARCPRRYESRTIADEHPECCGKPMTEATRVKRGTPQVIPDLEAHYNPAFGEVVRSRRHLKDLQKATDSVDFEPSKKQRERAEYAQDRMKYEQRHR